jgi:Zn-finger nucleic acid-binding protein
VPHRQPALACVSCGQTLVPFVHDDRHLSRCLSCHGTWMGAAELLSLLRAAQPTKAVGELMVHNDGSARRPCPVCHEAMDLAWLEFLQLDQCAAHGVWLDEGELQKVVRWEVTATLVGQSPPRLRAVYVGNMFVMLPE